MSTETYTKIELSRIQLEAAIQHYECGQYIPAITLAGASEEILGKILEKHGSESAYQALKGLFRHIYLSHFGKGDPDKTFHEQAVGVRNHLKHHSGADSVTFDARQEASNIIDRAIDNYWKVSGETELMRNFRLRQEQVAYSVPEA